MLISFQEPPFAYRLCNMNLTISQSLKLNEKCQQGFLFWQRFQNVVASVSNFENIIGQIPLKLLKASLSSLSGWKMGAYQMTFIILFITFSGNKFVIYLD